MEIAAIPIIVGVVQGLKMTGLPSRWAFLVSVCIGIIYSLAFPEGTWAQDAFRGLVYGLAASGLYSGGKQTINTYAATRKN